MSIQSTPDHKLRVVHTVCSGKITLADVEHYQSTVWLEPSIYGYNELYDFADSDYSDVMFGDLMTIAKNSSKLFVLDPASRFAFLTHTPEHGSVTEFYLAAKFLSVGPSRDLKSFDSRKKAMAWLTENYRSSS